MEASCGPADLLARHVDVCSEVRLGGRIGVQRGVTSGPIRRHEHHLIDDVRQDPSDCKDCDRAHLRAAVAAGDSDEGTDHHTGGDPDERSSLLFCHVPDARPETAGPATRPATLLDDREVYELRRPASVVSVELRVCAAMGEVPEPRDVAAFRFEPRAGVERVDEAESRRRSVSAYSH